MEKFDEMPQCCGSTFIENANRKQQNTKNVLLLVEKCELMLGILHKQNPLIRDPENCDVGLIFWVKFFTCTRNYYNNFFSM